MLAYEEYVTDLEDFEDVRDRDMERLGLTGATTLARLPEEQTKTTTGDDYTVFSM